MEILLVEDDDQIREGLELFLKNAGNTIFAASDGQAGMVIFLSTEIDLIITDMIMPKMNGLVFIKNVRLTARPVRIIAISGAGPENLYPPEELKMSKSFGANFILRKPFAMTEISKAVKEVFE